MKRLALILVLGLCACAAKVPVPAPVPDAKPSPLPSATMGQPYQVQLPKSGKLGKGSLPPGLQLSSSGMIFGTPSAVGQYSFTITQQ